MEELDWPGESSDLNPIQHIGMNLNDECSPGLLTQRHPTRNPVTALLNLSERLPRRVECAVGAMGGLNLELDVADVQLEHMDMAGQYT